MDSKVLRPRNIVIVSQFYAPEPCAAAHRVQALAQALAARGNRVHVIAPHPSFPLGAIDEAYCGKFIVQENDSDVRITRIRHIASVKRGGRILAWGSFAWLASWAVLFLPYKPDVIIVSSPPISVGLPGIIGRIFRGAWLVVDVRDVFPDLIVQAGIWKEGSLITLIVGAFARTLYRLASFVTVVTPTARVCVLRRAPSTNVEIFPNAADEVEPAKGIIDPKPGEFVATFAGNMGLANGMDVILDAAKILANERVRLILIGEGADYDHVTKRVTDEHLDNVTLLGVLPRESAVGALLESDASIVNLRNGILESIPTKIFDAFAVGCPVILSADGEARRVVEDARAGAIVQPGDASALAEAMLALKNNPDLAKTYAINGRALVDKCYNRDEIMNAYAERIMACW